MGDYNDDYRWLRRCRTGDSLPYNIMYNYVHIMYKPSRNPLILTIGCITQLLMSVNVDAVTC